MNTIEIKVPALGESVIEATIGKWHKQPGEDVIADTILVELETDKVTLEVYAPADGTISEILEKSGNNVKIGTILAKFTPGKVEIKNVEQNLSTGSPQPLARSRDNGSTVENSSLRTPKECGNPAETKQNTNPHGASDVNEFISSANRATASTTPNREELRAPMSRLRQRIAERLKNAQNTAAMITTFNEVDMSSISQLRSLYKDSFEKKHGVKLGFMSFFVKACVQGLQEQPIINSCIDGSDIITKTYFDIGIAVSTTSGLVVPIIRNADSLSLAEIEKTIGGLGKKGRDGKLTMDEMTGGTFTITNGGVFGSLLSTPIINPPQSAILGMHKIQDRAVVINGQIVIRPMMYLALSYDHRLIDGKEAVTFLVTVKECLENPGRFLLGL